MRERKTELRVPMADQVERLLRSFTKAPTSVRNRAIVAVLWRCGLRVSECLSLHPGDIDRDRGTLTVRRGKGGKSRTVGIDAGTIALVDAWVALRPKLGRNAPLFITLGGKPVSAAYVRSMLIRKSRKLGIPQLHPHALRHAHAVDLVREGVAVPLIQRALGHSSLATTAVYLQGLGADESVEAVRGREWSLSG